MHRRLDFYIPVKYNFIIVSDKIINMDQYIFC